MMGNTTTSRLVLEGASFGLLRSSGTARPGEIKPRINKRSCGPDRVLWQVTARVSVRRAGKGVYTVSLFIDDDCHKLRVVITTGIPGLRKTRSRF
jgi:hypothetical protein